MIEKQTLEEIKIAVHNPLNWKDYESTIVIQNTNCLSHAIGCTLTINRSAYRLGMLSGRKEINSNYFSREEVKELFFLDAEILELQLEEEYESLDEFIITNPNLADNQHIVALFVKIYGIEENILDFHFLRYDKQKGWSDKRWRQGVNFIDNIKSSWPSNWNDRLVGMFRITR